MHRLFLFHHSPLPFVISSLEIDGIGYFPDAPTERGVKHLRELAEASKKGYHCSIAFVIQMPGISVVLPNEATHPEFKLAFDEAGIEIPFNQLDVHMQNK